MLHKRDQIHIKRIKIAVCNNAWSDTFPQLQTLENSEKSVQNATATFIRDKLHNTNLIKFQMLSTFA